MRSRTRSESVYRIVAASKAKVSNSPVPCSVAWSQDPQNRQVKRITETMIDEEPVGGKLRPERSCYHSKEEVALGNGKIRYVYTGTSNYWDTTADWYYTLPSSVTYRQYAVELPDLLADILEKEDPAAQIWQGMPFIGEFKSTVQMVKNPLSFLSKLRVPKGMRQLPLGRVLTNLGLDKGSNAWLQYQYGWAPLMGDLRAVSKGCATMYAQYQRFLAGSGAVVCKRELAKTVSAADELITQSTYRSTRQVTTHLAKCNVSFQVKPSRDTGDAVSYPVFAARKLGFTPEQLLQTAWELTPYSFVVDWFIPVGNMLKGTRKLPSNIRILKRSYHHTCIARVESFVHQAPTVAFCNGVTRLPCTRETAVNDWTGTRTEYWRNWIGHGPSSSDPATGLTTKRTISALSLIAQRLMCPIRA